MHWKAILTIFLTITLGACASNSSQKEMIITQADNITKLDDNSSTFSGNVEVQMLFSEKDHDPSTLTGADVVFSPRARSAWHTHPRGQLLIIREGEGYVQQWGITVRKIKKGDIVWTPPGVKHWHGACTDKSLSHTALQEKKDGTNVVWMEKVTDIQYENAIK